VSSFLTALQHNVGHLVPVKGSSAIVRLKAFLFHLMSYPDLILWLSSYRPCDNCVI